MARYETIPSPLLFGAPEPRLSSDDAIRPNLRRAFPLPAAADRRFEELLAALAERGQVADRAASAQAS